MKKKVMLLALAIAGVLPVQGHPGVGIVMDRHGNVFYTDLVQVWMITPDGRQSVARRIGPRGEVTVFGAVR